VNLLKKNSLQAQLNTL